MKIGEVGEFGLIKKIRELFRAEGSVLGIGDDCAILPYGDKELLITTDTLVQGVHFFEGVEPYLLGRKSLAVNLSDIAAMAGKPKWAFLSLSLDIDRELSWIEQFLMGFRDIALEYDVSLLGGDTTSSDKLYISVTLVGENERGKSVKRNTARDGDIVLVTGSIGCSYAGFVALRDGLEGYDELKKRHLDPKPRFFEAFKVAPFATAMIDVSDGLIQDCLHICEESGVGMEIYWDKIPFCRAEFISKEEMLCGGEDYELVVCVKSCFKEKVESMDGFTVIGEVKKGGRIEVLRGGKVVKIKDCGYSHF